MEPPLDHFEARHIKAFDEIIDVRSPAEFAEDHIPGAINLPVLDNEERARVGYCYKQVSPFEARRMGAALVAANIARHIETRLSAKPARYAPLIYCWRGGQRSNAMATVLSQIGWPARTLQGGYKTYRAHVQDALYESGALPPVILLDGNTGTGKTALLSRLEARGVQTIDLEGLAGHRGSIFGHLGLGDQPAQKGFESALWHRLTELDPDRPVVVEAESNKIGARTLPPVLWNAMKTAPRLAIEAPPAARAAHLVSAYPELLSDRDRLQAALDGLKPLAGSARIEAWTALADRGAYGELAEALMVDHYDPAYAKSRRVQTGKTLATIRAEALDEEGLDRLAGEIAATLSGR